MKAFHSDPAIKAKYLDRVHDHRLADRLTQGIGWEATGSHSEGKGCAVGCTLESYDHSRYPIELGIPVVLAHLEDRLFELQTVAQAQLWPERFLSAIRPGADLSRVWSEWSIWMLVDPTHGVIRYAIGETDVETAILRVAELHLSGGTEAQWREAWAAQAAAWAAAWAAWAAWAAQAAAGAWVNAACDKLIQLLESV